MARPLKTPDIRVGDVIRIEKPHFFVRCGYPLCFWDEFADVLHAKRKAVLRFLKTHAKTDDGIAVDKIVQVLTYASLKNKNFGGNDRKIYTEEYRELTGEYAEVRTVRFVKTGERCSDQDGRYLANETTHRILGTDLSATTEAGYTRLGLEIEATNVTLVTRGPTC